MEDIRVKESSHSSIASVKTERPEEADKNGKSIEEIPVEITKEAKKVESSVKAPRCFDAIQNIEVTHGEALGNLKERVAELEGNLTSLLESFNSKSAEKDRTMEEFGEKMQCIQRCVGSLQENADKLWSEKESRDIHANVSFMNHLQLSFQILTRKR